MSKQEKNASKPFLAGIEELVNQILLVSNVPCQQICHEHAIVGSSVDPPTDDDIKKVARRMTQTQIAEAQRRAEDWIKRHTLQQASIAKER